MEKINQDRIKDNRKNKFVVNINVAYKIYVNIKQVSTITSSSQKILM